MYRRDAQALAAIAPEDAEARRLDVIAESIERTAAAAACELNKLSLRLRDRRVAAVAARARATALLRRLRDDDGLGAELEEEITNALIAMGEGGAGLEVAATPEPEEVEVEVEVDTETTTPSVPVCGAARQPEGVRIHACRHCGAVLLQADFVGRPVSCMDAGLVRHIRGECTSGVGR